MHYRVKYYSQQGRFYRTSSMKRHKISLKKYNKIEINSCILFGQNGIKIVININITGGIHTK